MVNKITERLLDGLFPCHCSLCRWPCPGPLPLCPDCRDELPANTWPCRRCALPLQQDAGELCGNCLQAPPNFDAARVPWLYGEYLACLLQEWKFNGARYLTPLFADLWLQPRDSTVDIDVIVPMPLHWLRQWQRGYNQAELLASAIQKRQPQWRMAASMLSRSRRTQAQSGMDASARRRNLQGAFTVSGSCANLRVALVDDVLTTGATADAAASALKTAGAAHVEIWCLARTPLPGD